MNKRPYSRGDIHKQIILEFIRAKSLTWVGVDVKDIINHIRLQDIKRHKGISRQSVNTHLNYLVAEGQIKKTRKGRYLASEIFDDIVYDGWSYFEDFLNIHHPFIVQNRKILDLQGLANIITNLSKKNSNRPIWSTEKFCFEFANRLGAYILYVFIESLRSRRNVFSKNVRSVLTEQFLKEAIPLMDLLNDFLLNLPIDAKDIGYYELSQVTLKQLSETYQNLYPNMAKSLDDGYKGFCDILITDHRVTKNSKCSHNWEKIYVHKMGGRYLCRKCDIIIKSPENINGSASAF